MFPISVVRFLCVFVVGLLFWVSFRIRMCRVLSLGVFFGVVSAPPRASVGGWLFDVRESAAGEKLGF